MTENAKVEIVKDAANARTRKIDLSKAIQLRVENGLSYQEIADYFNVNRASVHAALKKVGLTGERDTKVFIERRADILAATQQRVLEHLTEERLKKASVSELNMLFGTLYDKERLERGKSTQNHATFSTIVAQACNDQE
jgi:predicted DNA-binding protein YlxM (UPF0122 family)